MRRTNIWGILLFLTLLGTLSCEKWSFDARRFINTGEQLQLETKSAVYRGTLGEENSRGIRYVGHCWSAENDFPDITDDTTQLSLDPADHSFISQISPLSSNRAYYIRAYIMLADGTVYYGEVKTFVTATIQLTTESVINQASTRAEVVGRVLGPGLNAENLLDSIGHVWRKAGGGEPLFERDEHTLLSKDGEGVFKTKMEGLENGVNYQVRSFAIEDGQILYGNTLGFSIRDVWQEKRGLPVTKYGAVSFVIDNKVFVGLGRKSNTEPTQTFYMYDPETDEWQQIDDYPGAARHGAVAFTIGKKAYVGLGTDEDDTINNTEIGDFFYDFWVFDYETMSWSALPPTARFPGSGTAYCSAFALGGIGYVGLGYVVVQEEFSTKYTTRDFYQFDPVTNQWSTGASILLPDPYYKSQTMTFVDEENEIAYLGGGVNYLGEPENDFWQFDRANGWKKLNSRLPGSPRADGISFVIGRKAYIGTGNIHSLTNAVKDFWEYDMDTGQWTERANLSGLVRVGGVGFSLNGLGYIAGGSGCSHGFCTDSYADVWSYFPKE